MDRRSFLSVPLGAGLLAAQAADTPKRAIIELRCFRMRNGHQVDRTTEYLRRGWLPAAQRAGAGPFGFFSCVIGLQSPFILSLASYSSLGAMESAREKLSADKDLQTAQKEYDSGAELSYIRMESSLLHAFPAMPQVEPPPTEEGRAARIFELRMYESPSELANDKKVKMFADGEIAIFRRSGMLPVFFGQAIAGPNMPNLTYMLAFDDMAARDKGWKAFGADPDWRKLRATPGLSDAEIVSNISNSILRPLPFSPIR